MDKRYEIIRIGKNDAFKHDDYLIGEKFTVIDGRVNKTYPCAFTGKVKMDNAKRKNVTNFMQVYVKRGQ